jgi:hypothetical protein
MRLGAGVIKGKYIYVLLALIPGVDVTGSQMAESSFTNSQQGFLNLIPFDLMTHHV